MDRRTGFVLDGDLWGPIWPQVLKEVFASALQGCLTGPSLHVREKLSQEALSHPLHVVTFSFLYSFPDEVVLIFEAICSDSFSLAVAQTWQIKEPYVWQLQAGL